jgi:uncharacterized protein YuzE
MNRKIDRENDAIYFRLTDATVFESGEVQPGVILDFDEDGRVVGVEMLARSTRIEPDKLRAPVRDSINMTRIIVSSPAAWYTIYIS